jgi:hypothetical protein
MYFLHLFAIIIIECPFCGILMNVLPDPMEINFISDNVVIISGLPGEIFNATCTNLSSTYRFELIDNDAKSC